MIRTLLTMAVGILVWTALAPARWHEAAHRDVADVASDAYQLVRAWAGEAWRWVRRD